MPRSSSREVRLRVPFLPSSILVKKPSQPKKLTGTSWHPFAGGPSFAFNGKPEKRATSARAIRAPKVLRQLGDGLRRQAQHRGSGPGVAVHARAEVEARLRAMAGRKNTKTRPQTHVSGKDGSLYRAISIPGLRWCRILSIHSGCPFGGNRWPW